MPVRVTCPRGHAWEEADVPPGARATCPECGGTAVVPAERPDPAASTPTLLQTGSWHPVPLVAVEPPPVLADFEILGELGRGGMGIVYKARWRPAQDLIVALKVIRKDRLTRDEAVRRFRREAQAAARLDHPNIVQVYDSDHSGDTHYLVMEYVDGLTLERRVEQQGAMPVEAACDYIRQAALGLQHAHEQALVHRDIKPSNLMVTLDGDDDGAPPVVKILDMGVARVLQLGGAQPGESLSTLTQGGAVIGTADYVAPEQLENPHAADIRADLYSLGCTFHYLLTGQVTFPGGTLVSKLDKQRWQTPTPVDQVRMDIPASVAALVRKLLAKKPGDRFQTPAELARALEELARSGYTGTGAPTLTIGVTRRLEGHAAAIGAVALSPDGALLASGGKDRCVRLWDLAAGTELRQLPQHSQEIRALAFAPDGARFATAAGVALRVWDLAGQELRRCAGHSDVIRAVGFTPDGARLVSASEDKTVRVWDLHTGRDMMRLARHTSGVTCFAVTPDGARLISGSRDQTLRLWDLRNGQELRALTPAAGPVLALALSPDGRFAVSAHFDTKLRLWDVRTGREIRRYPGHKQMPSAVAFTGDGRQIVSGSQDQTVRLWDVDTGCELASVRAHKGGVTALAALPRGQQVISGGADGVLCILELPAVERAPRAKPFSASGEHI
jgi:WD40 repeat protein/tRNA A-37 threonylcarbamoyl transferase component Bud32